MSDSSKNVGELSRYDSVENEAAMIDHEGGNAVSFHSLASKSQNLDEKTVTKNCSMQIEAANLMDNKHNSAESSVSKKSVNSSNSKNHQIRRVEKR